MSLVKYTHTNKHTICMFIVKYMYAIKHTFECLL